MSFRGGIRTGLILVLMGFACHESLFLVLGVDGSSMEGGRLLLFLLLFGGVLDLLGIALLLYWCLLMLVLGLFLERRGGNGGSSSRG